MKARQAKRLARTVSTISLLVVIGAGFSSISSASEKSSDQSGQKSKYVQVVVTPGESIWSIAALVAGEGDIASVVSEIVEVNQLKSDDLAAGSQLLIPVL